MKRSTKIKFYRFTILFLTPLTSFYGGYLIRKSLNDTLYWWNIVGFILINLLVVSSIYRSINSIKQRT